MEQTDGVVIKHARNGLEYRLPKLPQFNVDGYCTETNIIYEFLGAIGKDASVNRFVTSSPKMETPWQPDTIRKWHDSSR